MLKFNILNQLILSCFAEKKNYVNYEKRRSNDRNVLKMQTVGLKCFWAGRGVTEP